MDHVRCAQCRNPIRGRQPEVRHTPAEMSFHLDCWFELHQHVQQDYLERVGADGVDGLLMPYSRTQLTAWLPAVSAEVDDAELARLLVAEADAPPPAAPEAEPPRRRRRASRRSAGRWRADPRPS